MNRLPSFVTHFLATLLATAWAGCAQPGAETQGPLASLSPDNRYIVHYQSGVLPSAKRQTVNLAGGTVLLDLPKHGISAVHLSETALANLQDDARIAFIEVDARRTMAVQDVPWGIPTIQADQLPATPPNGDAGRVKVCIIDSGIALGHEDLFETMFIDGTSDGGTGNWFEDGSGHGTHVAGTIAALNNDVGVIGVAPMQSRCTSSECLTTAGAGPTRRTSSARSMHVVPQALTLST